MPPSSTLEKATIKLIIQLDTVTMSFYQSKERVRQCHTGILRQTQEAAIKMRGLGLAGISLVTSFHSLIYSHPTVPNGDPFKLSMFINMSKIWLGQKLLYYRLLHLLTTPIK